MAGFSWQKREIGTGQISGDTDRGFQLCLTETPSKGYNLAQVDDYMHLARSKFLWDAPFHFSLEARVSGADLPGTWGFGLWNDPFSIGLGGAGMFRALPVLPNAAWFFYGSSNNFLSLRDDLPGKGFFAGVFSSPLIPSVFLLPAAPVLPFLFWPASARLIRRIARQFVREDACSLTPPAAEWRRFDLIWQPEKVQFIVDDALALETSFSPRVQMGIVIWIDNQYMCFSPNGQVGFGVEPVPVRQSLFIRDLQVR